MNWCCCGNKQGIGRLVGGTTAVSSSFHRLAHGTVAVKSKVKTAWIMVQPSLSGRNLTEWLMV
jgi:hypothetical protein